MKEHTDQPNILFVLMDDMGYGDMGCFGSPMIRTPVMDRLAESGAVFTQMYAAPICSPSRCGLLTGCYAQRVGIPRVLYTDDTIGLTPEFPTIATVLGKQGYRSSCIGKWHLGCCEEHLPTRNGFDEFLGLLVSNDMDPLYLYDDEEIVDRNVDQATLTRMYSERAIDFIMRDDPRPFLCYVAHTMPHIPLHVEEAFRGVSRGGLYGDTIECIDFYLGKILDALEESGRAENTLVIVTSDNGPWFEGSPGPLRGQKFEVYEGGIRVPTVARWPRQLPPGSRIESPVSFHDILPTLYSLAGGNSESLRCDGVDISGCFRGDTVPPDYPPHFYYFNESLNAVRRGKWKLHVARGARSALNTKEMPQLFDLELDEGERYNLAQNFPDITQELVALIESQKRKMGEIQNAGRPNGKAMSLAPYVRGV